MALTKLEKEIKKNNITYIDLKNIFLTQEEILYHKGDSHWNNKGAALAHNYLMKATNYSYTDFSQEEYVINSKLDIFVTFETMNNRGKNLSQLELLKNRLIYP